MKITIYNITDIESHVDKQHVLKVINDSHLYFTITLESDYEKATQAEKWVEKEFQTKLWMVSGMGLGNWLSFFKTYEDALMYKLVWE